MAAPAAEQPSITPSATAPTAAEARKTVLGKYILGRMLGRGSFAKVYLARSIKDNEAVAIKIIDKAKTDPSMAPRIIREVEAMRRLDHPNILKIHEVMASKSKIYLVMELAKGGDLAGKLARRSNHRFPEPIARRYFQQLVSALHYCHQNGVTHRDIKPQNLLLNEEGNIRVSDFGLSFVASSVNKDLMLQTACGTPAFAAPEVVGRSKAGYDGAKADAWSCGVILFALLTGYLPFDDSNLVLMYRRMLRREYRFPSWVTRPARALITRLLDPNPATRMGIDQLVKGSDSDSGACTADCWLKCEGQFYSRSVSLVDVASLEEKAKAGNASASMNAFEIISMSSGLDLSGLFCDKSKTKKEERFTSKESKAALVEKLVEVGTKLGYQVERTENCCVVLGKGRFVVTMVVSEVAPQLVVVDVKVVKGAEVGCDQEDLHWGELKSGLADIAVSCQQ